MITLHNLKRPKSYKRKKKRTGRGLGSGKGTNAGSGEKGQATRSGRTKGKLFEGGRMPIYMQLPKIQGFKSKAQNIGKKPCAVNVSVLDKKVKEGGIVSPDALKKAKIVSQNCKAVKILGKGKLAKRLRVQNCLVSKGAEKKIKKAGGAVETANRKPKTVNLKPKTANSG